MVRLMDKREERLINLIIDEQREFHSNTLVDITTAVLDATAKTNKIGIICSSSDCVFYDFPNNCFLKTSILTKGACPHYNPDIKVEDVLRKPSSKEILE